MTKTEQRQVNTRLRVLRSDRKAWLAGRYVPQGVPWCYGPGSTGHQEPFCDGCGTVAWARARAAELTTEINRIEASLTPDTQEGLW